MSLRLKERFNLSRFIRGEKPKGNSILLTQKRVFILPTQKGLGFVALIILLLLIAFVYNNNLAYLLAFLLASVFFITIVHSFKSLAALQITQGQCPAVFSGESAGLDIIVKNPGKFERFNLQINLDNSLHFTLSSEEKKTLTLYSATDKRGWHIFKTVTLSSTFPLGFFRAWSPIRFEAKALVYPKPNTVEIPFPETAGNQAQNTPATNSKGSDDFYGLKEYQPGDPIKHIHWKAFAKGQGLFSKQYDGDNLTELWLNYEQTPGHNIEERLSQLCRWVIDAEKAGLLYGFRIPGITFDPDYGPTHYAKCLEALALF